MVGSPIANMAKATILRLSLAIRYGKANNTTVDHQATAGRQAITSLYSKNHKLGGNGPWQIGHFLQVPAFDVLPNGNVGQSKARHTGWTEKEKRTAA